MCFSLIIQHPNSKDYKAKYNISCPTLKQELSVSEGKHHWDTKPQLQDGPELQSEDTWGHAFPTVQVCIFTFTAVSSFEIKSTLKI